MYPAGQSAGIASNRSSCQGINPSEGWTKITAEVPDSDAPSSQTMRSSCTEAHSSNPVVSLPSNEISEDEESLQHPLLREKKNLVQFVLAQYPINQPSCDPNPSQQRKFPASSRGNFKITRREKSISRSTPKREPRQIACPFYVTDPDQHLTCLTRPQLRTPADLIDHLWHDHRQAFYCPMCKHTFPTAASRDAHIVQRCCALRDVGNPPGISDDHRRLIARKARRGDDSRRYAVIWGIVFPGTEVPASPYLQGETAAAIAGFRRYWSRRGQAVISEYLDRRGLKDFGIPNEERDLSALYASVEMEVVDMLVADRSS
ncbi:hypothetical protein C8034_v009479 [Colletotrichum sidae]|uniref:C2H2-type domain-containing protein n=1 Tax=Colletotrichum sidae TaxID=1347389 RepID=A0A4V3I3J2_9PEZI|nr:hypothetical protein C8034_v009479 [Colletotrichum sidae]